jgi:hypothetical protein
MKEWAPTAATTRGVPSQFGDKMLRHVEIHGHTISTIKQWPLSTPSRVLLLAKSRLGSSQQWDSQLRRAECQSLGIGGNQNPTFSFPIFSQSACSGKLRTRESEALSLASGRRQTTTHALAIEEEVSKLDSPLVSVHYTENQIE